MDLDKYITELVLERLQQKGFRCRTLDDRNLLLIYHVGEFLTPIRTMVDIAFVEYDDAKLVQVAKRLVLDHTKLLDLIDCSMTEEEYRNHLIGEGHITIPERV